MCVGLSGLAGKDLRFFYVAPDLNGNISHSKVAKTILLSGLMVSNEEEELMPFEFQNWSWASFRWDTSEEVTPWMKQVEKKLKDLIRQVRPLYLQWRKEHNAEQKAHEKLRTRNILDYSMDQIDYTEYRKRFTSLLDAHHEAQKALRKDFVDKLAKFPGCLPEIPEKQEG